MGSDVTCARKMLAWDDGIESLAVVHVRVRVKKVELDRIDLIDLAFQVHEGLLYFEVQVACINHRQIAMEAIVNEEVLKVIVCHARPDENVCVNGIGQVAIRQLVTGRQVRVSYAFVMVSERPRPCIQLNWNSGVGVLTMIEAFGSFVCHNARNS